MKTRKQKVAEQRELTDEMIEEAASPRKQITSNVWDLGDGTVEVHCKFGGRPAVTCMSMEMYLQLATRNTNAN